MCERRVVGKRYDQPGSGYQRSLSRGERVMSTNQVLIGIGLIFFLAVASQVLAARLRIPALIILLPAGFIAGTVTSDVNPVKLLGPAFEPAVSVAVAVILYDAGLGLDLTKLPRRDRRLVFRLIILGLVFSFALTAVIVPALLGMSAAASIMLAAILVVTGPTVVGPLLDFVRPAKKLQQVLAWEGSLMDPIGALFGAAVFHTLSAGSGRHFGSGATNLFSGLGIGAVGAIVGVALLWLVLHVMELPEVLGTNAQLAVVVAVAAICDVFRTDSGLVAAILMGLAVSNLSGFDISVRRPFFETLVQLIIGLLFVSIAATITPSSLRGIVLPTIGLVAVLVLIARPLTAWLATMRTDLKKGERAFVGWMAPRGIVAAATATTFSTELMRRGVAGAEKILPVTFLVIVVTVALYGLSAMPVASRLGVLRSLRSRPLLVGGGRWVIDLARTLRSANLDVLMWAGYQQQRDLITRASLPLAQGELASWTTSQAEELEGITAVYLLTDEDDFNATASLLLHTADGPPVYTLAPQTGSTSVAARSPTEETLFAGGLDRSAIDHRYDGGATIDSRPSDGTTSDNCDILFVIDSEGRLKPATQAAIPAPRSGDTVIVLAR
jgi:NhaP-type Na+/H+ or K+/H+ antiporter